MAAPNLNSLARVDGFGNPSDGVNIGNATTDKVAFYGTTPITQRTSAAQASLATTVAISTGTIWGFASSTQANALVTLANELRAAMVALGLIKGS